MARFILVASLLLILGGGSADAKAGLVRVELSGGKGDLFESQAVVVEPKIKNIAIPGILINRGDCDVSQPEGEERLGSGKKGYYIVDPGCDIVEIIVNTTQGDQIFRMK